MWGELGAGATPHFRVAADAGRSRPLTSLGARSVPLQGQSWYLLRSKSVRSQYRTQRLAIGAASITGTKLISN
jgi:hypothetical protein